MVIIVRMNKHARRNTYGKDASHRRGGRKRAQRPAGTNGLYEEFTRLARDKAGSNYL